MEDNITIRFSIKRFLSSKDKDFTKALMIYNNIISVDTKTSANEIIYFVDHATSQPKREMFFFGLYANGTVVGFVEAGFLTTTKTIIIDYIVLQEGYRLNSVFYPLFSLVQRYFSEAMVDYDYIATEVSTKCPEESVDEESFFSKKMLQMEDFRIIDMLYRQPRLGLDNLESNFDFQLMIKSTRPIVSIKKQTYLSIIYSIYFEHYFPWYDIFDKDRSEEYQKHLESEYALIVRKTEECDENIRLSNQAPSCAYYKAPDCHFNSSTAGFAPNYKVKHRALLFLGIPLITICAFGVALIIYLILTKMQIQTDKFAGIFAAITALCTGLFTLVFSKISKSS